MNTKPVRITCDSACDLSPELQSQYSIGVMPMYVLLDGKSYQDGVSIFPEDIYAAFDRIGILPTTSAALPGEYEAMFAGYVDQGYDVVHIALSSGISSTFQNAAIAAEPFEGVFVVDSLALSCSGALLAIQAAKLAGQGRSAAEIAKEIELARDRTSTNFIVASLTYLVKGGRCSALTAVGANALGIKPSVDMHNGKLVVGKKYRGKQDLTFQRFLDDQLQKADQMSDHDTAYLYHAGIDEDSFQVLVDQAWKSGVFQDVLIGRAGAIISSHCGRNTIGFSYQRSSLE